MWQRTRQTHPDHSLVGRHRPPLEPTVAVLKRCPCSIDAQLDRPLSVTAHPSPCRPFEARPLWPHGSHSRLVTARLAIYANRMPGFGMCVSEPQTTRTVDVAVIRSAANGSSSRHPVTTRPASWPDSSGPLVDLVPCDVGRAWRTWLAHSVDPPKIHAAQAVCLPMGRASPGGCRAVFVGHA